MASLKREKSMINYEMGLVKIQVQFNEN